MKRKLLKSTMLSLVALMGIAAQADEVVKPDMFITFPDSLVGKEVEIGIGGTTAFQMDWGDGIKKDYTDAAYYSSTLKADTLKVYGSGIMLLLANNCNITGIGINNEPSMSKILANNNHLKSIDVSGCPLLRGLYLSGNELTSVKLGDANRAGSVVLDFSHNKLSGAMDVSKWKNISQIDVTSNDLTELTLPTENDVLYKVICDFNRIASLDIHGCTKLDYVSANANELTSLDLTGDTNMTEMYVASNKLQNLDITSCTSLENLTAYGNELTTVDLSKNKSLEGVYLYNNQLTELDLSNNANVKWLNVENNKLQSLNTTNMAGLSLLLASNNQLQSIDLSNNSKLSQVKLGSNNLTEFPDINAPYLSWLKLDHNQISSVSLDIYPYLYWAELGDNKLTTLNVSDNTDLQWLAVENNSLTTLDITKNKSLQGLTLQGNQMDKDQLNSIITALPDVSSVEINYNNKAFAKKLNISNMPGTADADVATAKAKGWDVVADIANAIHSVKIDQTLDGKMFDLQGRSVNAGYKGIVIENGKKIIK